MVSSRTMIVMTMAMTASLNASSLDLVTWPLRFLGLSDRCFHNASMRVRVLACVVLVLAGAGCREARAPTQLAPAQRLTPTAGPSPQVGTQSLGDFGPPDFASGGITVSTKRKSLEVWRRPKESSP